MARVIFVFFHILLLGDKMKRKKVLITGAGSGLGKEAAISLARRGHRIYATVYYPSQMKPLIEISQKENLNMEVFLLDVSKSPRCTKSITI